MQSFFCLLILFYFSFISANEEHTVTRKVSFQVPDVEKFIAEGLNNHNSRDGRIGSGYVASSYDYPFVGDATTTWPYNHNTTCTGSLISIIWFITARSCIINSANIMATYFTVYFGSAIRSSPYRVFNYGDYAIFKTGTTGNPDPEYALVRLGIIMNLSDTIKPILLPRRSQSNQVSPFPEHRVDIVGWGEINSAGEPTLYLRYANFYNNEAWDCPISGMITRYHFCSRTYSLAVLYSGDFGGPVVVYDQYYGEYILIGVTNYFIYNHAISTNIGLFMEFISETTGIPWRY
ncbi:hypothetical protein PVAND_014830 [Polypedilum vanderplanki]|uniref:Peptidase S1 domain-containing protein n=1 Tax=Polypedilum vanderplanki TaxID=319348 RepID=A0A9J6BAI2_POLVA|nr:hypothetical protein PVAND_014830 [Polypedilum vanderplanki]